MIEKFKWGEIPYNPEDETCRQRNQCLITILAFDPQGIPHPLGSGFIIQADGATAVAVTATHVFDDVRTKQKPMRKSHPSTHYLFPEENEIDLDYEKLMVICYEEGKMSTASVDFAFCDKNKDITFFQLSHRDEDINYFKNGLKLENIQPNINDLVVLIGFQGMKIESNSNGFTFERTPLFRYGYITQLHDSHILCRESCVETTIPVFPGMSGCPAFIVKDDDSMIPFGVLCSDTQLEDEDKYKTEIAGSSIISLLNTEFGSNKSIFFKLNARVYN